MTKQCERYWRLLWRIQIPVLIILAAWPVSYGITRAAIVVLMLGIWAGALLLFWKNKYVRSACGVLILVAIAVFAAPDRKFSRSDLRQKYSTELQHYLATKYVWGGENSFGIDCSGLVRRPLITAHLKLGLASLNPTLLREGMALWWFDASARALRDGYRGKTKQLFESNSIKEIDHTSIQPGEFAITSDGIHALAYLGNERWIEADPALGKVVILPIAEENVWLKRPVSVMRWVDFD